VACYHHGCTVVGEGESDVGSARDIRVRHASGNGHGSPSEGPRGVTASRPEVARTTSATRPARPQAQTTEK